MESTELSLADLRMDLLRRTVTRGARVIELSTIYEWYRGDFESQARAEGQLPSVLAWIRMHALPAMRADLERAEREGYEVRYLPYDWSLSSAR